VVAGTIANRNCKIQLLARKQQTKNSPHKDNELWYPDFSINLEIIVIVTTQNLKSSTCLNSMFSKNK
jgi:hypothetical protein